MKAPEEYLAEARFAFGERWGKTEEDIKSDFEYGNGLNKLMSQEEMDKGIAIAALKAMQADHDREFEDFVAWWYKDNPLVDKAKQLKMITQFRKG